MLTIAGSPFVLWGGVHAGGDALRMFKYGSIKTWVPTAFESGYLLKSPDTLRTLLVTVKGVEECTSDGKPLALIDCGPLTLGKLQTEFPAKAGG